MRDDDAFIGQVEDYLVEFDGATPLPGRVRDAIHSTLPGTRQVKASSGFMWMLPMRTSIPSSSPRRFATFPRLGMTAVAVVALGVVGLTVVRQPAIAPAASPSPAAAPGTLVPVAGAIDCERQGLETGTVLGCSSDGTRRLIQKGLAGNLFVLDADGSETQVSEALQGTADVMGSSRPTGATISPDGSRVVFAGKARRGRSCHDGALFAVSASGGPAELLWKSQRDGIVRDPTFSPDGTQIAFADGYCDSDQSVWVMNADGSDPHRIGGPIGAGHAHGVAWSPAGDGVALSLDGPEGGIYIFATDGSGLTTSGDVSEFCWPGRRCPSAVGPAASPSPTATFGTAEPVSSPIACLNTDLPGTLLACSRDGARLLIQRGLEGTLVVLDADGSETQVSEALPPLDGHGMSARPSGATISPDGSRVVFAGVTKSGALTCHNGALFAVDAAGGPAEVLWRSQAMDSGGIVRDPVFSPDGTQIAFADGYCDWNHSVWVMNADGSDARRILDIGPTMGAGYVRGLAWSPAGDRLALLYQGWDDGFKGLRTYTLAPDGSGLTQGGDGSDFCWPGQRC